MDLKEEKEYDQKIINDVNFKLKLPKKKTELRELFLNEPFLPGQESITKAINTDKASALLNLKDFNDIIKFDVDFDEYYRGILCGILTACFYIKPGKYISSRFPQPINLKIFLKIKKENVDDDLLDNISDLCTSLEFNGGSIFISDIIKIKNLIENIGVYNDNDMKNLVDLYNIKQPKVLKLIKTHANKELYLKYVEHTQSTLNKKSILINS